jgi:two-component system, response regulator FlrC
MKSPVLIVEDNDDLREEIYHLLTSESIECVAVSNGMDALSYVTKNEVSLILSDVNMSPMNGFELLVHVKRLFQPIPFLLLTAFSSVEKAVAAMKLGAVDYLTKPLNPKELIEKIKTYQVDDHSIENKEVIASDSESIKMFNLAKKIASSHSSI